MNANDREFNPLLYFPNSFSRRSLRLLASTFAAPLLFENTKITLPVALLLAFFRRPVGEYARSEYLMSNSWKSDYQIIGLTSASF
jgi:hypothetical protein